MFSFVFIGGRTPLGYKYERQANGKRALIVDPLPAQAIKEMYRLYRAPGLYVCDDLLYTGPIQRSAGVARIGKAGLKEGNYYSGRTPLGYKYERQANGKRALIVDPLWSHSAPGHSIVGFEAPWRQPRMLPSVQD